MYNESFTLFLDTPIWSTLVSIVITQENIYGISSDARINGIYADVPYFDKKKQSAPKNLARDYLCYLLSLIKQLHLLDDNSVISLEADPSPNDSLQTKVYEPMGFVTVGDPQNRLMTATVGTILAWCSETFPKGSKRNYSQRIPEKKQECFYCTSIEFRLKCNEWEQYVGTESGDIVVAHRGTTIPRGIKNGMVLDVKEIITEQFGIHVDTVREVEYQESQYDELRS